MDFSSPQVTAAIVAGVVSLIGGAATGVLTYMATVLKFQLDNKTFFQAESVARKLMMDSTWRWRTFDIIKHHLGGFKDDELRQILVRAGAIRTSAKDGTEVWGLLDRVDDYIGVEKLSENPGHRDE